MVDPAIGPVEVGAAPELTLHRIQKVTEAALAHLELDELLPELLRRTVEILDSDTAAVLLLTDDDRSLIVRATHGIEGEEDLVIPVGEGFAGKVAAEKRPIMVDNVDPESLFSRALRSKGINSMLGVPLLVAGRPIGVLHVGRLKPRPFADADARLLELVADRVAYPIDHARLFERERQARAAAQAAEAHLSFLVQARDLLIRSFEGRIDWHAVAQLAVPLLGDACFIYLDSGGTLTVVAEAHAVGDPPRERGRRAPAPRTVVEIVESGRAHLFSGDADAVLRLVADEDDKDDAAFAFHSAIVVPLGSAAKPHGALALMLSDPARAYGGPDLSFAEELADRIGMVIDIRKAYERERQFTSDVAHELRTPLTALVSAGSLVMEGLEEVPEDSRRPVQLMIEGVGRMRRLVDELLEIARLDASPEPVTAEYVEMKSFISSVVRSSGWTDRVVIEGERVTLSSDRRRLERILSNLIDNAVVHGGDDVRATVSQERDRVIVDVADRGPGIEQHHLGRIFDRFYKIDPARTGEGNGLGLSIALENARLLGGTIEVSSRPDEGSTFRLSLPMAAAQPETL